MTPYCVKCREKVNVPDSKTRRVTGENSIYDQGPCPHCGTTCTKIIGAIHGAKKKSGKKKSRKKSSRQKS